MKTARERAEEQAKAFADAHMKASDGLNWVLRLAEQMTPLLEELDALNARVKALEEEVRAARNMRSKYTDAWRSQSLGDIAAFENEIPKYDEIRKRNEKARL